MSQAKISTSSRPQAHSLSSCGARDSLIYVVTLADGTIGHWLQALALDLNGHLGLSKFLNSPNKQIQRTTRFLLSVRASVLRHLGIAVFWGQGPLVRVKHIFGFGNVRHLVRKVICGRVSWLPDFVPESRTSPVFGRGQV